MVGCLTFDLLQGTAANEEQTNFGNENGGGIQLSVTVRITLKSTDQF